MRERMADAFEVILRRRMSRRGLVRGISAGAALLTLRKFAGAGAPVPSIPSGATRAGALGALGFAPLAPSSEDRLCVPSGYRADVLLRWGDALFEDAPAFDLRAQSAQSQRRQFGFNCDFNAFLPLAPGSSTRGLLCTNHEYTRRVDMCPGCDPSAPTREQVEIEIAAHGMSIAELRLGEEGRWRMELGSPFNRRITADTPMELCGPAAGSELLRTAADPSGTRVLGTLSNCGGGRTPWGSVLTCEEKFHEYFAAAPGADPRAARYEIEEQSTFGWDAFHERFGPGEPREAQRFGWVVEIDPYDPDSTPIKRTALGRFKHEAATTGLADDRRVVVYSGDDDPFEYVYKFVSAEPFDPGDRARNLGLLDRGTLYVARFSEDGSGEWLPLVPQGPLADWSQAEILVFARAAADRLGATPMDRPEDIEVEPLSRRVYLCMTNNRKRAEGDGAANPRAKNANGHVLELAEAGGDLGATRFAWNHFLLCGDPARSEDTFYCGADPASVSPIACPDNLAFDDRAVLWLATDGQSGALQCNDAIHAVPTAGPERGAARCFLTGPIGAEICGPEFTPDFATLFVNVQHPGEGSGLEHPESRWPDGGDCARPSVVAVRRADGGRIGS